jgi:hypothetical protein
LLSALDYIPIFAQRCHLHSSCSPLPPTRSLPLTPVQSIDDWWAGADLWLQDRRRPAESAFEYALRSNVTEPLLLPRSFVSLLNSSKLDEAQRAALIAGAPFDAAGDSAARVHYTVANLTGNEAYWVYNFNLFYAWNGCSSQAIALGIDGAATVTDYLMCPPGVHEADFERVSVLVCKSDLQAKRVAYSQHAWAEERDCTQPGACPLTAEGNPEVWTALEGHGNYAEASPLMVYDYQKAEFRDAAALRNLGGLWLGDRTLADPNKRWTPKPELLVYTPPLEEIEWGGLDDFEWAAYPGQWGAPLAAPALELYCLNATADPGQTRPAAPCPAGDAGADALRTALAVLAEVPGFADGVGVEVGGAGAGYAIAAEGGAPVQYPRIAGPLLRPYSYGWDASGAPPLARRELESGVLPCPADAELAVARPEYAREEPSTGAVVDYLWGIVLGDVLFSAALCLLLSLPMMLDKRARVLRIEVAASSAAEAVLRAASRAAAKAGAASKAGAAAAAGAVAAAPAAVVAAFAAAPGAVAAAPGAAAAAAGDAASWARRQAHWLVDMRGDVGRAVSSTGTTPRSPPAPGAFDRAASATPRALFAPPPAAPAPRSPFEPPAIAEPPVAAATAAPEPAPAPAAEAPPLVPVEPRGARASIAAAGDGMRGVLAVWGALAAGLWVAGTVLAAVGAAQLLDNSVISVAAPLARPVGTVASVLEGTVIGTLALTGACDLLIIATLLVLQPRRLRPLGAGSRCWVPNPLGGRAALRARAWGAHVACLALAALVVNVAALLFAVGFVVVMLQLGGRVACNKLLTVSVLGYTAQDVCVSVPGVDALPICGADALAFCFSVTNMRVRNLVLGAACLLWAHLIWLIVLCLRLQGARAVVVHAAGGGGSAGGEAGGEAVGAAAGNANGKAPRAVPVYAKTAADASPPRSDGSGGDDFHDAREAATPKLSNAA